MSELRHDVLTGRAVIIARARHGRPRDHERLVRTARPQKLPVHDPDCPFCPGGVCDRAPLVLVRHYLVVGGWRARIIENAFPALKRVAPRPIEEQALPAQGRHEVIIETPRHDHDLADMSPVQFKAVVEITLARMRQLAREREAASLFIFRNHGAGAGSSLVHAHGQILTLPFVPSEMDRREAHLAKAYEADGRNPFQVALETERTDRRRIVGERPGFLAYVPFAAETSFELRIQPVRASADPFDLDPPEISPLAELLQECLIGLREVAGDPPYNLIWSLMSRHNRSAPFAGWYITVVPRTFAGGGFERASGMSILSTPPEENAARLRHAITEA
jgi:UDPglucose--hexose-1-phosphate uridylyltransferase